MQLKCLVFHLELQQQQTHTQMASSSSRGEFWNSPTSFTIRNRYCRCNRKATIKISESERNPHKLYFCCTNCRFFEWYEGPEEEEVSSQRERRHSSMQREEQVQIGRVEQQYSIVTKLMILNLVFLAIYMFIQIMKSV